MRFWKFIRENVTNHLEHSNKQKAEQTEASSAEETKEEQAGTSSPEETKKEQAGTSSPEETKEEQAETSSAGDTNGEQAGTSSPEETKEEQAETSSPEETKEEQTGTSSSGETKKEQAETSSAGETKGEQTETSSPEETKGEQAGTSSAEEIKEGQTGTSSPEETKEEQAETSSPEESKREQAETSSAGETKKEQAETSSAGETKGEQAGTSSPEESKREQAGTSSAGETKGEQVGTSSPEETKEEQVETSSAGETKKEQAETSSAGETKREQTGTSSPEETKEEQTETSSPEEIKKEKIKQLRDKLLEYKQKKEAQHLQKSHLEKQKKEIEQTEEEKYPLSEHTNEFLKQLQDLPSFQDRDRSPGYAIDTEGYTEIPNSMIRTLITKFLNQRFCKQNTDLNVRSNSLEKAKGFYKWEVKDVITHLKTHQVTKVFDDKYGYEYAQGKNENVPLSFYFDMSGSMSEYTNMLAVIAIELLKKNVKVLIGFNERVNVQIDTISKNINVTELVEILESAGYSNWGINNRSRFKKDARVSFQFIDKNLDNYLLSKKAEKCVVFSDFDPLKEVTNLSCNIDVYWFCFERNFEKADLNAFHGFIYQVKNTFDIAAGLIKVNENRFEALCYIEKNKSLQKKIGGK